jgi:transposase-like protein
MEGTIDTRRRHSSVLKARVLAACARPGALVTRVAMEHGLNANLVHKWRRRASVGRRNRPVSTHSGRSAESLSATPARLPALQRRQLEQSDASPLREVDLRRLVPLHAKCASP